MRKGSGLAALHMSGAVLVKVFHLQIIAYDLCWRRILPSLLPGSESKKGESEGAMDM